MIVAWPFGPMSSVFPGIPSTPASKTQTVFGLSMAPPFNAMSITDVPVPTSTVTGLETQPVPKSVTLTVYLP